MAKEMGVLLLLFAAVAMAARPQLVNSDVWVSDSRIIATDFQTISGNLEFDQPLYLAESLLCPQAEQSCEPVGCRACDWSGQNPTGCDDLECCGPAEYPRHINSRNDWCSTNPPHNHTQVQIGVPSATFTLASGETKYFRFFLSEETLCYPVAVKTRIDYGNTNLVLSRVNPWPTDGSDSQFSRPTDEFCLAQSDWVLCPNFHEDLGPGTWSVGVTANRDTSFHLEVFLGPEQHPISSSPDAIPCSEVPESEFLRSDGDVSLCLEEGKTTSVDFTTDFESFYAQVVMPIPEGCHTVNFVVGPPRPKDSSQSDAADADIFCLPTDSNAVIYSNSLMSFWQRNDDRMAFTGCFEETTYVHCSAQLWTVGEAQFLFSIVAQPYRFPILETLPGALTMDQGLGAVTASIDGVGHYPCGDWYSACFEWTTYPSTDPLTFWPQHGSVETLDTFFDPIPTSEYFNRGLAKPLENAISFSIALLAGNERIYTLDELLEKGTLTLPFVTNAAGEPVEFSSSGEMRPGFFGSYLPSIAFSSLDIKSDVSSECSYETYSVLSNLIDSQVSQLLEVTTLADLTTYQFSMDVFNAGLVRLSCLQAGEAVLEQKTQMITKTRQTSCEYESGTSEWEEDPCCNDRLEAITCCIPFDLPVEENLFTEANSNLLQTCGSSECAKSFFDDLGSALNTLNDPLLGCNSGIKNLQIDLNYVSEVEFDSVLRYCRYQVGLGEGFIGMPCRSDTDCADWVGTCGSGGFCDLPTLSVVEDQYLNCYIDQMSSVLEDYLRREVLGGELEDAPKTSSEFFDALRLAASEGACVSPSSPLELSKRTRREWLSQDGLSCKGDELGLSSPEDDDKIMKECPTLNCLGSSSCWGNLAETCYRNCDTEWVNFAGETEEFCGSDVCNVDLSPCEGGEVCVYCAPDGSLPCQLVEGIVSQEDCEALVACQLLDGEIILGITEDECNAQKGVCSVECPGESCQSLRPASGGCFVSSISDSSSCDTYSSANGVTTTWVVTDVDATCALDVSEESDCSMYPSTSWSTCSDLAIDECDGTTATQVHLQCYRSLWQPCTNQEDCENTGACSDRDAITTVRSENPFQVDLASCFSSGFSALYFGIDLPFFCHSRFGKPIIGCKETAFTEEGQCTEFEVINGEWYWRRWLTPAMSEAECVNKEYGRYGCLFPGDYQHLSWHNDTYCECMGGFPTYAWEWEKGRWVGGQSRPLSWVSIAPSSPFEYKSNALSFSLLEQWLTESIEDYFLYSLKSQILCENNVITVPLRTVVCDCLADDSPKDSSCYDLSSGQRATPVGFSAACSGETSLIKGPSANANFYNSSIKESCTQIGISIIEQNWFTAPPSSSQVSFQFERNEPRRGFVKNQNDVTVGELVGDGCQLEFSDPQRVDEFNLCLLITSSEEDGYPVRDFGWSDSSLDIITPLGISSLITERRISSDSSTFWCADVSLDMIPTEERGIYRVYPIAEMEDYEDQEEDYVDNTTEVLCYILGAFYIVDFFLLVLFFFILVRELSISKKSIPVVAWLGVIFIILCVFRIVYLFAYPNGVFEDEELAEFVVFEIPTFLLFTAVFLCIFFWRNLAQKKNFFGFEKGSRANRFLVGGSVFSVWMLFLVVTVVYSEVILDKGEEESDCPGRVGSTSSLEDDSRILSIVYQSIIITVTFLLAVVFFQSSYVLFRQSSKGVSSAKHFIFRMGVIVVCSFFLRCIFFIILLAAEFTSSIYMFIVLMITEVLMIFLIHLLFNMRYYRSFFSTGASNLLPSGMNASNNTTNRSGINYSHKSGTELAMDD